MKKVRFSLGEGGLNGFLARHVEKVVLALTVVLVAFFFFWGYSSEGLPEGNTPESLQKKINTVKSQIELPQWEALKEARPVPTDYVQRVVANSLPTDEMIYQIKPLLVPPLPPEEKRTDPKLYPPTKLEVHGAAVPLAIYDPMTVDLLAELPPAMAKPVVAETPAKKTRNRPTRGGGGDPRAYSDTDSPMPGGAGGDISSYDDTSGYGTGGYGSGGAVAGQKQLTPAQRAELGDFQVPAQIGSGIIAKSYFIVAVKAIVPYESQWKEYELALSNSQGYNLTRDTPQYYYTVVQRAEVDPDSDPDAPIDESVWKVVSNLRAQQAFLAQWPAAPDDLVHPASRDPILTAPIPPILNRKLDDFALHSEIPRQSMMQTQIQPGEMPQDAIDPAEDSQDGGLPSNLPLARGGGYGGPGGIGMGPGGPGGMMPGGPGGGYGGASSYDSRAGEDTGGYGAGGYDAGGGGYDPMGGYGGGGYGMGARAFSPPKHKLVRFFDTTAEGGKSYRYRIKLMLLDPNRPANPAQDPASITLHDDVAARLKANPAPLDEHGIRRPGSFSRDTEWSEPSPVITVPPQSQKLLAGTVNAGRSIETRSGVTGANIKIQLPEPSGTIASVLWNQEYAVNIPGETEVWRGSPLNFKQDAELLHPVTLQFKSMEGYQFTTHATIVDIRGGETLPGSDRNNPLLTPGEFLLMDGDGNLITRNELDDIEEYRRSLFIADEPVAGAGGYGGGYDMMPGPGGMPGPDAMPGPGGMSAPPGGMPGGGRGATKKAAPRGGR